MICTFPYISSKPYYLNFCMYLCLPDLLVAPFSRYFVSFFEASESIVFVSVSICLHSCYCPSLHPFIEGWGLLFWNFPQMECSEFFNKKGEVVLKLGGITNTVVSVSYIIMVLWILHLILIRPGVPLLLPQSLISIKHSHHSFVL